MKNFVEIKKEIEKIMLGYKDGKELIHANGTLNWVLKIKPDADEAMQIAAFAHDIERCLPVRVYLPDGFVSGSEEYLKIKKQHAVGGSTAVYQLLQKYGVDESECIRIKNMIANHEEGGDEESDIIRDADSMSYLEDNLDNFLKKYGAEVSQSKVDYMFGRISEERKYLALDLYQDALEKIKKFSN